MSTKLETMQKAIVTSAQKSLDILYEPIKTRQGLEESVMEWGQRCSALFWQSRSPEERDKYVLSNVRKRQRYAGTIRESIAILRDAWMFYLKNAPERAY